MRSGSTGIPSDTSTTGILVALESSVVIALSCFGSRCWISTNAMPDLAGSAFSSAVNAASPPADAPMATTGKESPGDGSADSAPGLARVTRRARNVVTVFLVAIYPLNDITMAIDPESLPSWLDTRRQPRRFSPAKTRLSPRCPPNNIENLVLYQYCRNLAIPLTQQIAQAPVW